MAMFRSAKVRYCAVLYVKQRRRSTVLFGEGKVRHSSSKRGLDLQCIAMAVVGKDLRGHCIAESRRGMDGQCQAEEWQSLARAWRSGSVFCEGMDWQCNGCAPWSQATATKGELCIER